MNPSWIWSDKITNERVARVGYYHFISNKGEWNNCFSKFSTRVLFSSSFYCYNAVSYVQRMTTLIRQCQRMTVKLLELAIKSELKVAMWYQISKTVAMRCKNRCYVKFTNLSYKARVTIDCVTLLQRFWVGIWFCGGTNLPVRFFCLVYLYMCVCVSGLMKSVLKNWNRALCGSLFLARNSISKGDDIKIKRKVRPFFSSSARLSCSLRPPFPIFRPFSFSKRVVNSRWNMGVRVQIL